MKHIFNVGDRVRHSSMGVKGEIVGRTTLDLLVAGDCEDEDADDPWYMIKWDHDQFIGNEFEGSLVRI